MRAVTRSSVRQFFSFAWGSAVGLSIDLAGFQVLLWGGASPALSNIVSSTASITVVYFLVARFSFDASASLWSYLAFVAWYGGLIVSFSLLIQLASLETGWNPLLWKLASVPVSFTLNYLFSRFLFSLSRAIRTE